MFEVGQVVRFKGRKKEQGKYHPDYVQLLGQVGTIVDISDTIPVMYDVIFSEFPDNEGFCDYPCFTDELEVA